jgi:hypothetical protein
MSDVKLSKSQIIENINQAFLQLEFSIKLFSYFENKKVNKDEFDTDVIIPGTPLNSNFYHNSFQTYNDLVLGAENTYSISIGFTAIVLDDALQSIGVNHDPRNKTPNGLLRTLVYMIRCAYAHNMMYPMWNIQPKYEFQIKIPLAHNIIEINFAKMKGQPFNFISDIGGLQNYLEIKKKVCQLIDTIT